MEYDANEQFRRADIIIDVVCDIGGCTYCNFLHGKRSLHLNLIRGLAFYLSWEYGVHARRMAICTGRTRGNVINQSKRYRNYIQVGDPMSVSMYKEAKERIDKKFKKQKQ